MAIKKNELYSSLWSSFDKLHGGMNASQYKDYILTLLFMKYVSDKYAGNPHGMIEIPDGGSFDDLVALKNNKKIGDKINTVISFRSKNLNDRFKIFCFHENDFRKMVVAENSVSTNTNINQDNLKSLYIAYPIKLEEQDTIACMLSDMENEIEILNKRINK